MGGAKHLLATVAFGVAWLLVPWGMGQQPRSGEDWKVPELGMEFVWVPSLEMWVGKYEVTNAEYHAFDKDHAPDCADLAPLLTGDRQPACDMTFADARDYVAWLNRREREAGRLPDGFAYRLPTKYEAAAYIGCGVDRRYPWGSRFPPEFGNYQGSDDSARLREEIRRLIDRLIQMREQLGQLDQQIALMDKNISDRRKVLVDGKIAIEDYAIGLDERLTEIGRLQARVERGDATRSEANTYKRLVREYNESQSYISGKARSWERLNKEYEDARIEQAEKVSDRNDFAAHLNELASQFDTLNSVLRYYGLTHMDSYSDGYDVSCPVEESGRNEWGIFGVGGNVWEMIALDVTEPQHELKRVGASWSSGGDDEHRRFWYGEVIERDDHRCDMGFRVVLVSRDRDRRMYVDGGSELRAEYKVDVARKEAEAGRLSSMVDLGNYYAEGQGVVKDEVEAVKWFRKAAEAGDALGMANLGVCLAAARGVPLDLVEAVKWFRLAADAGDPTGMFSLGFCLATGQGVPKDDNEAVKWFKQAARSGHKQAQESLRERGLVW